MRLSKSILKKNEADDFIMEFIPNPVERNLSEMAKKYLETEEFRHKSFRINDLLANQVGISEKAKQDQLEKVELRVLEKLKEVQESAYKEAYNLGLEEGKKAAFEQHGKSIQERLERFDQLLGAIENIRQEMFDSQEAQMIKLLHAFASRIAMREIDLQQDRILPLLKSAIDNAKNDEQVVVKLSDEDYSFIQQLQEQSKKEFEAFKRVKFESNPEIRKGGCIIETNYGVINASIEERVKKLWTLVDEASPTAEDNFKKE